jgi:hypothetical protein
MLWKLRMLTCCNLWLKVIPGFILVKDLIQWMGGSLKLRSQHKQRTSHIDQLTELAWHNVKNTGIGRKGNWLPGGGVLRYKWSNKNEINLFKMQHCVLCYPVFLDIQGKPLIVITLCPAVFYNNYRLITLSEGYNNWYYLTQIIVTKFYMYKYNKIYFNNLHSVTCFLFAFSSSWMNFSYS